MDLWRRLFYNGTFLSILPASSSISSLTSLPMFPKINTPTVNPSLQSHATARDCVSISALKSTSPQPNLFLFLSSTRS